MKRYKYLLSLLRTKNSKEERIIKFQSNFVSENEWLYSNKEELRKLVFMEEFKNWLQLNKHALLMVNVIDDWEHWHYIILLPDIPSPFFEPNYNKENEYYTYQEALLEGLITICEIILNK